MVLYPVNLDISGRLCVVIGGGSVAARKIESLLLSGAVVLVVSPEVCAKIRVLAQEAQVEWLQREYRDGDLTAAFMVFAATNHPDVQQQVADAAVRQGSLLNNADNPDKGNFQVPAKFRRGNLLIAVSTEGSSPALSTQIKHRLEQEFGPEYGILVDLMARIRQQIVGGGESSEQNRLLFQEVLGLPILEYIRECRWNKLQEQLDELLPSYVNSALLIAELERETR